MVAGGGGSLAEVPVRQPRFLGERVPYREQSMQEQIQSGLPGYDVEQTDTGYVARAKAVQYLQTKKGSQKTYSTYVPSEIIINKEGQVVKETTYGIYTKEHGKKATAEYAPYVTSETDYSSQTKRTYGTRDLKSGRETVQLTSESSGGQYRENRIIHQDSKEYEIAKEQNALFQTFVGEGMSYAQARQLSRATEQQREEYFRQVAKQRTAQYSLQGKAITYAHQESRRLGVEVQAQAQQYSTDIVRKQEEARKPVVVPMFSSKELQSSTSQFRETTPSSPTKRTDMADTFFIPSQKKSATISEGKPMIGGNIISPQQYERQQRLSSDNAIQKAGDVLTYRLEDTKFGGSTNPYISEVVAPVAIGAGTIVLQTASHPVEAFKSMLQPYELVGGVVEEARTLTATKGELYSMSFVGGQILGAEAFARGQGKAVEFAKDVYVKAGSTFVSPESVFSEKVLKGEQTFPTTRSTAESLKRFNQGGKSYNLEVAKDIVANPEKYAKPPTTKSVEINNPVIRDIERVVPSTDLVYTGGVARKILTGEGRIRDVDVVVKDVQQGRELAYKIAERYPEKYEVIKHEKYPEIYRLREKKTEKVRVDFDPRAIAEEGQIRKNIVTEESPDIVEVGGYKVVSPEVQLKSKAMQIVAGKTRGLKQGKNIQQLNPDIKIFEEGVVVSTVSPTAISGRTVVGKVEKVGLEDPGIFVSPKGEASAYFTGIESPSSSYTLNPFKNFGVPTVTEFSISKVTTYPRSVVMKPGFAQLEAYQRANVGKGRAYITKRSQIGTGDVPRQSFVLEKPTVMSGETVEAGLRVEAGTSEIEAVIGVGESFTYVPKTFVGKIKGFDYYTTYKGRAVAVRKADVLNADVASVVAGKSFVGGEKIMSGQEAFSDLSSGRSYKTPVESVAYGGLSRSSSITFPESASVKLKPSLTSSVTSPRSSMVRSNRVSEVSMKKSVKVSSKSSFLSAELPKVSSRQPGSSKSSVSALSSGRSFGGSSEGGSSGKSGGSSGGGSSTGGSSGKSYGAGQDIPREITRTFPKPKIETKQKKGEFEVQVRKKGKFINLAITETPEEAFRIGTQNVRTTASASLRVRPVNSQEKVSNVGKAFLPMNEFYESKKEPDVFIQRREKRIGSFGEKREITFRGIQANRVRNIFNKRR